MTEIDRFSINHIHDHQTFCQMQDIFNGICQTLFNSFFHNQTIHNNLNIVFDIFIQYNLFRKFIQAAIYTYPDIAAFLRLFQKFCMGSLSPPYHRSQKLNLRSLRQFHNLIHHLIYCLLFNLFPTLRTMRNSNSRIQKTKIVIDLRHRSHRGTWISIR